jgi:hypothetical protein
MSARDPQPKINYEAPVLHDADTGDAIRNATQEETAASRQARQPGARHGVIEVDGQRCYVLEWDEMPAARNRREEAPGAS